MYDSYNKCNGEQLTHINVGQVTFNSLALHYQPVISDHAVNTSFYVKSL